MVIHFPLQSHKAGVIKLIKRDGLFRLLVLKILVGDCGFNFAVRLLGVLAMQYSKKSVL